MQLSNFVRSQEVARNKGKVPVLYCIPYLIGHYTINTYGGMEI
jgi:hypothetical protein